MTGHAPATRASARFRPGHRWKTDNGLYWNSHATGLANSAGAMLCKIAVETEPVCVFGLFSSRERDLVLARQSPFPRSRGDNAFVEQMSAF